MSQSAEVEYVGTSNGRLPIVYRALTDVEQKNPHWVTNQDDGENLLLSEDGDFVVMSLTGEIDPDGNIVVQGPEFLKDHWKRVAAAAVVVAAVAVNYHGRFSAAPKASTEFQQRADLATVWVGGRGKISTAFKACNDDQYLLLSGCNTVASPGAILSANGYDSVKHLPRENIKFGYSALDTTGNAKEICDFLELSGHEWIDEVVNYTYSSHVARSNQALQAELDARPDLARRVTFKWVCIGGNNPWQGSLGGGVEALKTVVETIGIDPGPHMRPGKLDIRY